MDSNHETVKILRAIWNQMKALNSRLERGFREVNGRLDQANVRLDETNARLDQTNARLDQTNARLDQSNARLDQTIARLDHVVEFIGERYRDHGRALQALDRRVSRLESRPAR
jgi:uncharacterized coiled-coil DUF342 family protein